MFSYQKAYFWLGKRQKGKKNPPTTGLEPRTSSLWDLETITINKIQSSSSSDSPDGGPVRAQTGQRAARHHDHRVLRDILAVCPAAVVPVARALHIRMPMQSSGVRDDISSASVRLYSRATLLSLSFRPSSAWPPLKFVFHTRDIFRLI